SEIRLIPKEGAVSLLRNDPQARGPRLFAQHCGSCHSYDDGTSLAQIQSGASPPSAASNLFNFATRHWARSLLSEELSGPQYFGNTAHKTGRMATWLKQNAELLKADDVETIAATL